MYMYMYMHCLDDSFCGMHVESGITRSRHSWSTICTVTMKHGQQRATLHVNAILLIGHTIIFRVARDFKAVRVEENFDEGKSM